MSAAWSMAQLVCLPEFPVPVVVSVIDSQFCRVCCGKLDNQRDLNSHFLVWLDCYNSVIMTKGKFVSNNVLRHLRFYGIY